MSERTTSTTRRELRALWTLALPLAAIQLGNQLKSLVDTAVVGRLGDVELASVGLGNSFFFLVQIFGVGVMMGFDPMISQALGADKRERADGLLWQSVWLAIGLGALLALPAAALAYAYAPAGIEAAVADKAWTYTMIRVVGLIPTLIFFALRGYLQAHERTRPLVASMVLSNLVNVALTVLLVFGGAWLPEWAGPLRAVPALGVAGAAWATVVSAVVQAAVLAPSLPMAALAPPNQTDLQEALRLGGPVGLQYAAEVGVFALVGFFAGRMGSVSLAAHQVALTLASMTFTVTLGISSAGSVRVGLAVGAQDAARMRAAGLTALMSGTAFMSLGALLFLSLPEPLTRILTDEADIIAVAAPLLGVAAVFQLSDGLQAVGAGVLRGAGDTRFAFVANLLGHYLVGLPVALALGFGLGLGVRGLWWGLCVGLTAVAAALLIRFLHLSSRPVQPLQPNG